MWAAQTIYVADTAAIAVPARRIVRRRLAFQLARKTTGRTMRSYKQDENRRDALIELPEFTAAFVAAKERIRHDA